jgi:L-2-hydroxyglutarate oxidase LhgO
MITTDFLIIGSGIVGLSIAKELISRYPDVKVTLLEKESNLASHASGRNSGVIHAGFYYTPGSLKAKLTVEGNKLLTEYCITHGLDINRCGKFVVASDEKELGALYELKRRGDENGVDLRVIDEDQLKELEPNAKTFKQALYSPTTSPSRVVESIGDELQKNKKTTILFGEQFLKREDASVISTNRGRITFKYLINAAGLYADKVARQFGVGSKYTLIPFKGLYLKYESDNFIKSSIYPVPELNNPFLGTHLTKTVDGKVKIGPTAIPAFWREHYNGFSNFKINELLEIVFNEAKLFCSNAFDFRKIAFEESKKYYKQYLIKQASRLVKHINPSKVGGYMTPGVRAQLLNKENMKLVMDFVIEHGENSTHILNAVSPAFTCAFSFNTFVMDEIENKL